MWRTSLPAGRSVPYNGLRFYMAIQVKVGDQNNQKIRKKSIDQFKALASNRWLTFTIVLLLLIVTVSALGISGSNKDKSSNNLSALPQKTLPTSKKMETAEEKEKRGMLEYFLSDYLQQYPKFQTEVNPKMIKRVFPITLKKISANQGRGWLVEVEKEPKTISHYLLTPILEKELVNTMSCRSQDENPPIELEKVEAVGNEVGLGRDLQEKSGYLILSGTKNSCYGGANSGFISVYKIRTGEKIKLQGDFTFPSTWKGVSRTGNALGILRGIYGINQPTIVVEYGYFASVAEKVEEISLIAYFDLQTGELKQLVSFN